MKQYFSLTLLSPDIDCALKPARVFDGSAIRHTADYFLTEDGRHGAVIDALNRGSFPVICTHWQSMFSNGNFTGVKALAVVAQRIESHLSDRVEWVNFSEQAKLAMKDHIPRPEF